MQHRPALSQEISGSVERRRRKTNAAPASPGAAKPNGEGAGTALGFVMLAKEDNFSSLARINRELIAKGEALDSPQRVVLDMDSTETPVKGQQETSAYNGHFESTCDHPLLLCKWRPVIHGHGTRSQMESWIKGGP